SYTNQHLLTKTAAKAATCSESGNKEYWTCEHCGKYFLSDDTNPETAKAVEQSETILPALKHKNAITRGAVEPNGTKPGYSGDRYCPDCNTVLEKGYTYWIEDNLTWKLYEDGTLNISGTGAMKNYSYSNNKSPACSNLSVTSIVIEEGVTSIGDYAFENCDNLTSITIPENVEIIGKGAFYSCDNLKDVTLQDGVKIIERTAFIWCGNLTNIVLPNSITSIGDWAFKDCTSLTSIKIPSSVTSIDDPFYNCSSLKTISLDCGSSLKRTDFGKQADLVSYTPHTLIKTEAKPVTDDESGNKEYWTCSHCGKYFLSDDTNPETATAVELSEIIICNHKNAELRNASEPTETSPGYSGDLYCPDCDKVLEKGYTYWIEDNLTWKLYEDGTLNISGKGAMKDYIYGNNKSPARLNLSVTSIVIEEGVTSIGDYAFENCDNLTSITIPGNVESIGEDAFYNCDNLTDVTLQDGVKSIGRSAFIWCNNLTNIVLPNSVTSIGYFAFKDCTSLTSIKIPSSVTSMDSKAFYNCSSLETISLDCDSPLKRTDFGKQADLVSYTPHTLIKTEAKAATCTEDGNKAYWTCEHCGKYFLSDDTNPETATAVELSETVIPASHKLTKVEAKDATCTEDGNTEYWTCEHCGKYFLSDDTNPETAKAVELSETMIPASHKLTKVEAKAATCTEDGNIEYWQCDVCKKTFTDEAGKKTVDNVIIPALKHSYNENGFCENDDTHYQPANYNEEIEKYEISNAGQLYWFAEQVNSGDTSLNAVLTTDIVVNETVLAADGSLGADPDTLRMWRSIGDDDTENIFKGIFDGQGHTISGLYFSNDSNESDVMCASLFGFSAGIIQNVGLEDSYFNYYYAKIDGQLIVSGVAAGICAINNGQIVNCYNAGTILGYGASGICAINSDNGSIENCYNTGMIGGFGLAAGICNMNAGSMKDCYNNSDITVRTDSTIIDENDEKSYASGICNINGSSGRIENCYHVGQVSGADVNNNICNLNIGQIENSYYDCNICDKDAITQNESSAVVKNVESKTTKQFASGEVTYLLNGDQSVRAFYQNLATEKYPTLNQKSKVVMQLEMIYDESFGEDATTNKTYHNAGDTIALETSPDKAYTYQYFVNGKQIEKPNYTLTGNTKMTVKRVPVEIELSEIDTIQLTCQKKMTLDLTEYLKNFADLKPVQFQLDADSKLPDGLKLTEDGMLSGTPKKAATVKTTIVLTAENDSTKEMNLVFIVNAPVTTTTTTITTTTTTKATTTTKPSKTTTTKVTTTTKPNKTTTTKATTTTTTTISSYGDVNLDGMVDILDAVFLNKYLATLIQFSDAQMANADCCQDGVLNDQDTTALMQFIILLIDDLPVQPTEK
ncbi:MAG: leucine-rich repeat protein, partial [Ruminococcus sp.]